MKFDLESLLQSALEEDIPTRDITTELMIQPDRSATAHLIAKSEGVFFGAAVVASIFKVLKTPVEIKQIINDGGFVKNKQEIVSIKGSIQQLLQAERVMLNFLQRLSGVATTTRQFVDRLNNPKIKILDTRKTTPLLRALERQAVVAGGGRNHRFGLSDMILIKENHLNNFIKTQGAKALGGYLKQYKTQNSNILIEIEIENVDQLEQLDLSVADVIMFDNFDVPAISSGVAICRARGFKAEIEISGNVTLDTISLYSSLPIDRISIGSLTHSVKAMDLSLLIAS